MSSSSRAQAWNSINAAGLPSNWDGRTEYYLPDAPADWAKLSYIPRDANGKAKFGLDVRLPNMVYAIIKHSPALGGTLNDVALTVVTGAVRRYLARRGDAVAQVHERLLGKVDTERTDVRLGLLHNSLHTEIVSLSYP